MKMKPSGFLGVSCCEVSRSADDMRRPPLMGPAVVTVGLLATMASAWALHRVMDDPSSEHSPLLRTRIGGLAYENPTVAFSLSRMHSYLSLGVPSELVRERILSHSLAGAIGRDGRALVADVLDYAHEIMGPKRPHRRTRKQFFNKLRQLNQLLEDHQQGYFVYAGFEWNDGFKLVEQVTFDALAITDARSYRVGDRTIRTLHVERLGPARAHPGVLGFTGPGYDDTFVIPSEIDYEVQHGLVPALSPTGESHLFQVAPKDVDSVWYRQFRQRVADVFAADLAPLGLSLEEAARAALTTSVEIHELQHQLDYKEKIAVRGQFRELADLLGDLHQAATAMHETSAHLGQLARNPGNARVMLAAIAAYAFTDGCPGADCLAAEIILDELSAELGRPFDKTLMRSAAYGRRAVAERYLAITESSSAQVARAAGRVWNRLLGNSLPEVQRPHE